MKKTKKQFCPVMYALDKIGSKWKMPILWRLHNQSPMRYGELKKSLETITHRVLSSELKVLESDGFISRKSYNTIPPWVEYSITPFGKKVIPVINEVAILGKFLEGEIK